MRSPRSLKLSVDQANDIIELAPYHALTEIAVKLGITYNQARAFCKRKGIKPVNGNIRKKTPVMEVKGYPSPYVIPGIRKSQLTVEQINSMRAGKKLPKLEYILHVVCDYYKVKIEMVSSRCRKREFVWPRQVYCWLACRITKQHLLGIGAHIGSIDHTTVMYSRNTVTDIIKFDKDKEREIREIAGIISNSYK